MKRYICACLCCLPVLILTSSSVLAAEKDKNTLAAYLEQALVGNDSLLAAQAELRAASARVRQAGVLPDPKLEVQYYLQPIETRTGPQQAAIGIGQGLPWFGKLALMRKMGDHDEALAAAKVAAAELEVVRQVKETYIEYCFLGRSQQILSDNLELLHYLEGVARDRYTGGKATYFDVLKVQVELAQTEDKVRTLADQTMPLRVRLNNLLGTGPERSRPLPEQLPRVVLKKKAETIYPLALKKAPLLLAAQERIAKARTGRELADKAFFPDFQISLKTIFTGSAEYGDPPDSGSDPVIAGVSMNIPLFRERRHARVAEQETAVSGAQAMEAEQQRGIQNKIEQGLYAYRDAERRVALYRDELLPKVRQQLEVAVSGFQSGKNSILEIIDAEKSLLTFDLAKSRALADRALAVAGLEAQAGAVLASWTQDEQKKTREEKKSKTESRSDS
ncbi:MAG: TolC family protein [Candidatus Electrothrix sp. GW3-4]|uniref:TolC family protein n=1 Tax=Candidatus Electrothrix sp. GW3-4 TaxID=3126740 RepID=UPI0030D3B9EF